MTTGASSDLLRDREDELTDPFAFSLRFREADHPATRLRHLKMRDTRTARHLFVDAAVGPNRGNLDVSFFFRHVVEANGQLGSDGEPVRRYERLDVEGQSRLANEVVPSFARLPAGHREDHFHAVGYGSRQVGD